MNPEQQEQLRVHIRWMIRRDMAEVLRIEGRPSCQDRPSRQEMKRRAAALSGRFRSGLRPRQGASPPASSLS